MPQPLKGASLEQVNNTDSEQNLIRQAKEGDNSSFKKLFESNVSRVYAFCLRMTADKLSAEELTQDVFVKAWEKLSSFRNESRFYTWLHSIAVNEFLMSKRSAKRMMQKLFTTDNVVMYERKENLPAADFDSSMDLEKAIGNLPKQSRLVFILHDVEGYMHHEIADIMKVEVGTSKSHLHRARKLLREALLQ